VPFERDLQPTETRAWTSATGHDARWPPERSSSASWPAATASPPQRPETARPRTARQRSRLRQLHPQSPWGAERSDETPLTGETLAKVKAAALAEVPSATIVRIETDADGHAAYEAHVVKADGAPATVYVDKQFDVVSVESR
jgi:hypothetical protein